MSNTSNVAIPKSVSEAQDHPSWQQAMDEEMTAIHANNTWELIPIPLVNLWLDVDGFTLSKSVPMV